MSMGMGMSLSLSLSLRQEQRIYVDFPSVTWSLVKAFKKDGLYHPPYEEADYNAEIFTPRLKLRRTRIDEEFDSLPHEVRLWLIDEANKVFHFAYNEGEEEEWDDEDGDFRVEKRYYRIQLLRDIHANMDDIAEEIDKEEYDRATAILNAVGDLERIARAIPYRQLYKDVTEHLRDDHSVGLQEVVLAAVDRGGRLPCIILMHALGLTTMESIKIDQGWDDNGQLDTERLQEFVARQVFKGKHVLFVDSTVDSGRQINVLKRYFNDPHWQAQLGHRSWSIVGSNEEGDDLEHHHNINWGVDPDQTFEDDPSLMGIDYAPGSRIKVIDKPSKTSEAIRKCLLSVPAGYIYWADTIDAQIARQRALWTARQVEKCTSLDELITQLTKMDRWQQLKFADYGLPKEQLPEMGPSPPLPKKLKVLVVGRGKLDVPKPTAQFVADQLGPHCTLTAGTGKGNPGAVLEAALRSAKVQQPSACIYQPEQARNERVPMSGRVPVTFVGPTKNDMRHQMISDADVILALGGAEGTLREVLLALRAGKPTVIIRRYGPVAGYVLTTERLRNLPNLKVCENVPEAVQTILRMATA